MGNGAQSELRAGTASSGSLRIVTCAYNCFDTAADVEVANHFCLPRLTRFHKILQHLIDNMFMKDTDFAVEEKVFLQRFQFDTSVGLARR